MPASTAPQAPAALGVGLLLSIVLVAFEAFALGTLMPQISAELRGLNLYGWASSAFLLSGLFGAVLSGLLADRRGIAVSAAVSFMLLACGLIVVATAPSMLILVMGRFLEGLGVGGFNVLPFAVISRAYQGHAQARMLAAVAYAWLIPGLIGPWLTSRITETWNWRAVLWSLLALLIITMPISVLPLRTLSTLASDTTPKRTLWYATTLMLFTALLLEGLRRTDLLAVPLLGLGALGLGWAWKPLFPAGIPTLHPGLPASLALRGAMAFAVMGTSPFLTLALRQVHHLSLQQTGWMISTASISWTIGATIQAWLDRRHGPQTRTSRIQGAALALTGGLLLILAAHTRLLPLWVAYAGWFTAGIGMGIGYNSNSLYAISQVSEQRSGQLSGQLANIEVLTVAIATGIGGALVARVEPTAQAITLILTINILVSFLPWIAVRRLRPALVAATAV